MMVAVLQILSLVWLAFNIYIAIETKRGAVKLGWLIAVFYALPFALILADFIGGSSAP